MSRLRMAVIGVGHLGKEHARILAGLEEVELVGVVDVDAEHAQSVARRLGTTAYADFRPLLTQVHAATIVVPTTLHFAIAAEFLSRGIPILVEKPLAADLGQAVELLNLAQRNYVILQVGHIERFNPAFEELQRRPLQAKFVTCQRVGPYSGRSTDIGVVLDLMIHDLDLLLALVRSPVRRVEAVGASIFGGHEDIANARIHFDNGCIADLTASRVCPAPERHMRVWGPEGYAHLDFRQRALRFIQPSENLQGRRFDPRRLKDELYSQHLQMCEIDCDQGDQLTRELRHFVTCVRAHEAPLVGGIEARNAIALAVRIQDEIRRHEWDGNDQGAIGPTQLPPPMGRLFAPVPTSQAA
jgi:predicted dehydrogenase